MADLSAFYDPKKDIDNNPVDYFNSEYDWEKLFKTFDTIEINENKVKNNSSVVGRIDDIYFITSENFFVQKGKMKFNFSAGKKYTKFQLLTKLKFNHNYSMAYNYVNYHIFSDEIPYIRIGDSYFKKTQIPDISGVKKHSLIGWKKDEITQDFGKSIFSSIPKFDGALIRPDNINYQPIIDDYYNWYSPFIHKPYDGEVKEDMIPYSMEIMNRIFGEQLVQGLKYLKLLYEHPQKKTYVLCLVSREGNTGKTTFLNWLEMIFLDNFTTTDMQTIESQFNAPYVTKNIIAIDEAMSDRSAIVEKIKNLTTAKKVPFNDKYMRVMPLDFFAKLIFCSNNTIDFIRIQNEEERFWVREIKPIPKNEVKTNIEECLKKEIPMFLKYLLQQPAIDFSCHRLVMRPEEIFTDNLKAVKENSRSEMYKEIHLQLEELFAQNELYDKFQASAIDVKNRFFAKDTKKSSSYINKVLQYEFKLTPSDKIIRYTPFDEAQTKTGKCFTFKREDFIDCDFDTVVYDEEEFKTKNTTKLPF